MRRMNLPSLVDQLEAWEEKFRPLSHVRTLHI